MNKNEKYHPTSLKLEMNSSNWLRWEIQFRINGLSLRTKNLIFSFLNHNICFGYSKEPSQWDGSFEHPKHMLQLIGKRIFKILHSNFCLYKPMVMILKSLMSWLKSEIPSYLESWTQGCKIDGISTFISRINTTCDSLKLKN